jgi:hypothetical protein
VGQVADATTVALRTFLSNNFWKKLFMEKRLDNVRTLP